MPNQGSSKQLAKPTHRLPSQGTAPPNPTSGSTPPSGPGAHRQERGDAPCARPRPRDPEARGRAGRHGGIADRFRLEPHSGRQVFLHRGPRPGALPDAGGAGAAGGHAGESASLRGPAERRAALLPPCPGPCRPWKATRVPSFQPPDPPRLRSWASEF